MRAVIFSSVNFTRMKAKVEKLIKLNQTIQKLHKFINTNSTEMLNDKENIPV